MTPRSTVFLGSIAVLAVEITDIFMKRLALERAPLAELTHLKPLIDFALHKNPGIAFDLPLPFFIILPLTLAVCSVFSYFAFVQTSSSLIKLSSIMVIVGALGNLIDRALNGFTTDYLILFKTSAINFSDVLILIGMLSLLWYHSKHPQPETI